MSRSRLEAAFCALFALAAAAPAQALTATQLRAKLQSYERRMGAASGALVRDADSGATLFSSRAGTPRVPASNNKLLVTATALLRLGPEAVLRTTLRTAATTDEAGVLGGNLVLVGAGDPYLDTTDLQQLAAQVADSGIQRITGRVYGDGSMLDRRVGSYDSGWAYDSDLGGSLGGLVTGEGDGRDPALHAASEMRQALLAADVGVTAKSRSGQLPAATQTIATVDSAPIRTIATRINVPSDNYAAELLLKDLGARFGTAGSTTAGAAVVRDTLAAAGVQAQIVDGSGLSSADRVSPRMLVRLLQAMADQGDVLRPTLATAGRTGTLAERMRRSPARDRCQAKTGTLDGVSALSGYCTTTAGAHVVFSFIENGVCAVCAKRVEDRMVGAIARYAPSVAGA